MFIFSYKNYLYANELPSKNLKAFVKRILLGPLTGGETIVISYHALKLVGHFY